ncbi:MAG: hypothetical protein ABSG98_10240 [Anaerolineales bacterium]|jgi:hypothetical protein
MQEPDNQQRIVWFGGLFLLSRLILLAALPIEGLRGYGDLAHFYELAQLPGLPFINYWVEFPPVFPFLSELLYRVAGGHEPAYDYLVATLFSLALAGSLMIFARLEARLQGRRGIGPASWTLFVILAALPYGWWYFDPLVLLAMLGGLALLLERRDVTAGLALAVGVLTKWFPGLVLVVAWRFLGWKRALIISVITLGIVVVVLGSLIAVSPAMSIASLRAQTSKGSWETPWALFDGNMNTGNFGPEADRLEAASASLPVGHPAQVPPWLTLILFGALGLVAFLKTRASSDQAAVQFLGLTWVIFLLWSPGWSPQWVLYLLPLILLGLPGQRGFVIAVGLTLINLLEWPLLLSRGFSWGLWITVPLRTLVLLLFGGLLLPILLKKEGRAAQISDPAS